MCCWQSWQESRIRKPHGKRTPAERQICPNCQKTCESGREGRTMKDFPMFGGNAKGQVASYQPVGLRIYWRCNRCGLEFCRWSKRVLLQRAVKIGCFSLSRIYFWISIISVSDDAGGRASKLLSSKAASERRKGRIIITFLLLLFQQNSQKVAQMLCDIIDSLDVINLCLGSTGPIYVC